MTEKIVVELKDKKVSIDVDIQGAIELAISREVSRAVGSGGYDTTISKAITQAATKAFESRRADIELAIQKGIDAVIHDPKFPEFICRTAGEPLTKGVLGGMATTFRDLGCMLGKNMAFRNKIMQHIEDALKSSVEEK